MKKESNSSQSKRAAKRVARVSVVLTVAALTIVAAGAGSITLDHGGDELEGGFVGGVAAQSQGSDSSGGSGSYNITDVDFGNQPLRVGEEIQVTATIRNSGNSQLSTAVGLGTQGEIVDSQDVSLFPGSSQQVAFTHEYESPGTYTMQVGTLNESNVMTQVDKEDTSVRVISGDVSTDVSGQVGTSATTGGNGVSAIPTVAEDSGSGGVPIEGDAGSLRATDLTIGSGSPPYRPGDLISFQSNISNPTSQQLNGSFAFSVDNGTVSQQTVAVPAGDSQSIVFTHRFAGPGDYTISVGNQTQTITVRPAPTTVGSVPNATTTVANGSEASSGGGGFNIGGLFNSFIVIIATVSVIIVTIMVAFIVWYRKTTSLETMNR